MHYSPVVGANVDAVATYTGQNAVVAWYAGFDRKLKKATWALVDSEWWYSGPGIAGWLHEPDEKTNRALLHAFMTGSTL